MAKIKNEYIRRTSQVGTRQERFTLFNTCRGETKDVTSESENVTVRCKVTEICFKLGLRCIENNTTTKHKTQYKHSILRLIHKHALTFHNGPLTWSIAVEMNDFLILWLQGPCRDGLMGGVEMSCAMSLYPIA